MKKLQWEVAQIENENERHEEGITSDDINQGYMSDTADDYADLESMYAAEVQDFANNNWTSRFQLSKNEFSPNKVHIGLV